jgi:nitroreductase
MSHPKHADPSHDILDVIRERWSPRAFDPSRDVALDDLKRLFEAARWAPSSFNEQPWRFVVGDRRRDTPAFASILDTLDASNRAWAQHAPVLVVVAVRLTLTRTGAANQNAWYDAGQAVGFLTLQATSVGLAIRQMEGFDRAAVARACGVPADFEAIVVMAIGYAGEPAQLASEKERAAEIRPRLRQPISAFVFSGRWGQSFPASGTDD